MARTMAASRLAPGVISPPKDPVGLARRQRLAGQIPALRLIRFSGPLFRSGTTSFSRFRLSLYRRRPGCGTHPASGAVASPPTSAATARALALAAALAGAGLLGACRNQPQAQARPPLSVQVAPVEVARFGDVLNTVSTLEAVGEVNMAAQASGRILQIGRAHV